MTYDLNITFDDNLITGNKTIDTQHKELIERIQNFVTACQNGDSKLKAIKMLDYLDEYTNFHFKEEEKLQQNAGYPEYEKHHEKHEEFKKTIQELQEYLQDYEGPTEQFSELVQKNVIDWLFGQRKMHSHLVTVEIGVERGTYQRMKLNCLTFYKDWLERLNTKSVQCRGTV